MADIWDEIHAVTAQQDELIKHRDWLRDQLAQVVEDLKPVRSRLRELHREKKDNNDLRAELAKGIEKASHVSVVDKVDCAVVVLRNGYGLTFKEIGQRFDHTGSWASQRFDRGIRKLRHVAQDNARGEVIARIEQARLQSGYTPMYDDPLKGRH